MRCARQQGVTGTIARLQADDGRPLWDAVFLQKLEQSPVVEPLRREAPRDVPRLHLEESTVRPVNYVAERVPIEYPFVGGIEKVSDQLLWTKYNGWQYEEEVRSWIKFIERDSETKLYFCNFAENIQLKEVIAGPLCQVTEQEIREALGDIKDVDVIKARLAFKTFRIVRMGWGFDTSSG